ncbi:hypothetical protein EDM00_04580 [Ornithobacterium rhinotracheale]|nr:hypothetical protein [Ornithobacterium rhinotracheale]MRJ08445.1 hypothetical protein [Ornithobacterium rhinotracheale]MRJ09983.1 hypothetical protein [Ornithobacterium rhinotracheale]
MFSILSLGLTSCLNNDDGPQKYQGYAIVTNVESPKTGVVGKDLTFNVTFQLNSTCAKLVGINSQLLFQDPSQEHKYAGQMEVVPVVESEDPNCSNSGGGTVTKEFKVLPNAPGLYHFKFYKGVKGEGREARPQFIEVDVQVNMAPDKTESEKPA